MGACCCRRKGVTNAEEEGYGPRGHRSCHDVLFLILFIAFWGGMIAVAVKGFEMGDLKRLKYGVDMYGNVCGQNNKNGTGDVLFSFNRQDLRSKPYLYWPTPLDTAVQVCVESCPSETPGFTELVNMLLPSRLGGNTTGLVCLYNVTTPTYQDVLDGLCWPPYKSTSVMGRCIPSIQNLQTVGSLLAAAAKNASAQTNETNSSLSANATDEATVQKGLQMLFEATNARETLSEVLHDVVESWKLILGLIAVSIAVSWLMLWVMRLFAGCLVWATVALALSAFFAVTVVLWKLGYDLRGRLDALPADERLDADVKRQKALEISAYVSLGLDVVLLLIVFALRKRIQIAIGIVKESSRALGSMPSTFFFPFVTVALQFGFLVYWVVVFLYLSTAMTVSSASLTNNTVAGYKIDHLPRYLLIYHLFGLFWTTQFIGAIHDTTMAGAVASWYWVMDKKKEVPRFVAFRFFLRVFRYHLGSLALGSLIVAIVQFIRAMLRYLERQLRAQANYRVVKWVLRVLQCCFWCIEKIIKFINRNAYIMIAIKGDGFCSSAARAFTLILTNVLRVGVVNGISAFLLFLFKVLVTAIVVLIAVLVLEDEGLYFFVVPVVIVGVGSWIVASIFTGIYAMAIDTILLSFCEDCSRNDGSAEKPYFMSANLKAFVDGHVQKKDEVEMKKIDGAKAAAAGGKAQYVPKN